MIYFCHAGVVIYFTSFAKGVVASPNQADAPRGKPSILQSHISKREHVLVQSLWRPRWYKRHHDSMSTDVRAGGGLDIQACLRVPMCVRSMRDLEPGLGLKGPFTLNVHVDGFDWVGTNPFGYGAEFPTSWLRNISVATRRRPDR